MTVSQQVAQVIHTTVFWIFSIVFLVEVRVCGNPNYNGHTYRFQNTDMSIFESAGGARGLQKAGTNEDLSAFL